MLAIVASLLALFLGGILPPIAVSAVLQTEIRLPELILHNGQIEAIAARGPARDVALDHESDQPAFVMSPDKRYRMNFNLNLGSPDGKHSLYSLYTPQFLDMMARKNFVPRVFAVPDSAIATVDRYAMWTTVSLQHLLYMQRNKGYERPEMTTGQWLRRGNVVELTCYDAPVNLVGLGKGMQLRLVADRVKKDDAMSKMFVLRLCGDQLMQHNERMRSEVLYRLVVVLTKKELFSKFKFVLPTNLRFHYQRSPEISVDSNLQLLKLLGWQLQLSDVNSRSNHRDNDAGKDMMGNGGGRSMRAKSADLNTLSPKQRHKSEHSLTCTLGNPTESEASTSYGDCIDFGDDSDNDNDEDEDECAICFGPLERGATSSVRKCNHRFHSYCVKSWAAEKRELASCPLCRTKLFSNIRQQ